MIRQQSNDALQRLYLASGGDPTTFQNIYPGGLRDPMTDSAQQMGAGGAGGAGGPTSTGAPSGSGQSSGYGAGTAGAVGKTVTALPGMFGMKSKKGDWQHPLGEPYDSIGAMLNQDTGKLAVSAIGSLFA